MSSLPLNATSDEIEEELVFLEVLISSLDDGADDFADRLAGFQAQRQDLETRLAVAQGDSRPQTSQRTQNQMEHMQTMDGSYDPNNAWWQTTLNGRPGGSDRQADVQLGAGPSLNSFDMGLNGYVQPNAMKRSLPYSLQPDSLHPSKRPTPEPSNVGTPASSNDSFEFVDRPLGEPSQRSVQRQMAAEETLRKQRNAQARDEEYARSLMGPQQPTSSFALSSSRPTYQTTLNPNGSYQRPIPQPSPAPLMQQRQGYGNAAHYPALPRPSIKQEPDMAMPQQPLAQRPRIVPEVVDLTNSDDEEEISEITPNHFTPNRRTVHSNFTRLNNMAPLSQQMPPTRPQPPQMPGAYPTAHTNGHHPVYGSSSMNTASQARYPWMQNSSNPVLNGVRNTVNGIQNAANTISGTFSDLSELINGSRAHPFSFEDDDDIVYGGQRQLPGGITPYGGYRDNMELYNERRAVLEHYDPMKTTEEINALLENIRPDEDLPAHLRVQTPEAMAVKLHKYQELGLTWLQKCEDSNNRGGILADDMGLGKTIQMLSLIVTRKSNDPRCRTTLIVAPVALMRQWKQEIEQKVKTGRHELTVFTHHGSSKARSFDDLRKYDIVLTTFGSLAAELKRLETFELRKRLDPGTRPLARERCVLIGDDPHWYRVILDEAQCIKNQKTQTAKAACLLNARFRFCMTGTPMMNALVELYSLIKFLRIKPYNEWAKFRSDFETPMKSEYTREKSMKMLQTLCKAIMMRRTKESTYEGQPILVLPPRTTEVENPEFSRDEESFYRALESRSQLQFNRYLRAGTVGSSYSAILVLLLRLRQAACHPHLIKDFGVSAAADVSPDTLFELAKALDPQVIERIKSTDGNFECPVCYDAVTNPAIFIPCGHDTCSDCFARIADPANAIRDGNEHGTNAKCPNCRAPIDPKRITDFDSFKKAHMPELLTQEEQEELKALHAEYAGENDDEDSDDSDTDSDTDTDEVDARGDLKGFIVNDDDFGSESEIENAQEGGEAEPGPSKPASKGKGKANLTKKANSAKKGKGRKERKAKKDKKKKKSTMTLAELKKLATRSKSARKRYMERLRKDWMSSAKIEKTMEALRTIMDDHPDEKVLVFSQWTSLLDLLEVPIDQEDWGYRRYDGSMNAKMRGDAVDDFRDTRKNVRIMLVSLKAGNAGLNLNAANNVIILDPFWNPYIEEQAIDRAHRLGQTKPVKVQRILVANTVEDRIIELQEKKRALISEALDEKAGQNIARLGVRELAYLFGVTRNAADPVNYVERGRR